MEILKTVGSKIEVELYAPKVAKTAGVSEQSVLNSVGVKSKEVKKSEQVPEINVDYRGMDKAKKNLEEIGKGFISGTNDELQKLKKDSELYLEMEELKQKRDATDDLEKIAEYNKRINEIKRSMKSG